MKKLLLRLGAFSVLAVLPFLGVVSCSLPQQTTKLNIFLLSNKTTVTQEVIDRSIDEYNIAVKEYANAKNQAEKDKAVGNKIKALSTVFLGLKVDLINNMKITANKENNILELEAIDNYVFPNQENNSESVKILKAAPSPIPTINLEILKINPLISLPELKIAINEYNNSTASINDLSNALGKIFTGKILPNIQNFYVEVIDGESNIWSVTLIAKPTFYFETNTVTQLKIEL